jgi:AcrR family transcriptional regulator
VIKQRRLNRERVVETAAEMADAAGSVEAVTLTALAAALDIRVPSLYNHVASLDDLRHALTAYGMQKLLDRLRVAAVGYVGRDALMRMADAYRSFAHEHPGIYPLTTRAPEPDDTALAMLAQEWVQMLLLLFASMGLQGDDALHAVRGLRALLHGFVALEAAHGFKMPLDLDTSFHRVVAIYLDGLTPSNPHIVL